MKRLPLVPTIIVAAAFALLIGLGFWQARKAPLKDALIARYQQARTLPPIAWPTGPMVGEPPLFRRASGLCLQLVARRAVAGRNSAGESGYSHIVDCRTGVEGPGMSVDIGWSLDPAAGKGWTGGEVRGLIVPDKERRMRLVSAVGFAGLQPSVPPSPAEIPNNHRQYAATWFALAAAAVVIYVLALRRGWSGQ